MTTDRKHILFLCTGNSCRSQMAEGLLRHHFGDRFVASSAGADPAGYVHPIAVQVMQELGIDISGHTSKHIRDFLPPNGSVPDLIIGVCSKADENCPVFPAAVERLHWPFDDPYHAQGDEQTRLNEFRRVRDEILARLKSELA